MKQTMSRLSLSALALVATAALAQAQTTDDRTAHHPGGQAAAQAPSASMTPPQAGMPMAGQMAEGGKPGAMGGGMGPMMEMMRPGMAGRGGMEMPFEHVEGRIAYLRAELKITDAQAAPWNAFADAMRADAAAMRAMHERMAKDGMPGTLPGRLAARQKMMSAHVGMLERMEAGAKPLYAALSAEQRTLLDQMTASPMGMM